MGMNVSPEARKEMITKKAYELFVKRGSKPGHELDDWLEAERLVDRDLKGGSSSSSSQGAPSQTQTLTSTQPRQEPTPANRPAPTPIRSSSSSTKIGGYKKVGG